jgi:hypothetical protein
VLAVPTILLDSELGIVHFEDTQGLQVEVYKMTRHKRGSHVANPVATAITQAAASAAVIAPSTPTNLTFDSESVDDDGLIATPSTTFIATVGANLDVTGQVSFGIGTGGGVRTLDVLHNGGSVHNQSNFVAAFTATIFPFSFTIPGAVPTDTIEVRASHADAGGAISIASSFTRITRIITPGTVYPDRRGKRFIPIEQVANGATSWAIPDRYMNVLGGGVPAVRTRKRNYFRFGLRDVATGARGPMTADLVVTGVRHETDHPSRPVRAFLNRNAKT